MNINFHLILIVSIVSSIAFEANGSAYPGEVCIEWFKDNKLEPKSKNCATKCATTMVDMGSFGCPSRCPELCQWLGERGLSNYVFYPGLTFKEKELIDKYPKEALIVFVQKINAEMASSRNFPYQELNDEGDAFRHFVWAGLLVKELGPELAKSFLDAHEENPLQRVEERAMDLANNRGGIIEAEKLQKLNKLDQASLEKKCLDELRNNKLVVINPGLKIPKEPL